MKTAIFLVGGVLVACSLYLSEAATLYRPELEANIFDFEDSDFGAIPNSTYHPPIVVRYMHIMCMGAIPTCRNSRNVAFYVLNINKPTILGYRK